MNGLQLSLLLLFVPAAILFAIKRPRRALTYLRYLVLGLTGVVMLTPFFWLISAAFKDGTALMSYTFFPPLSEFNSSTVNFENFRRLFQPKPTMRGSVVFWQYIINSLFFASTATMLQLFFSSMGGYALAKYRFKGSKLVMFFMLGSMMIPGIILLAPVYQMMFHLGWINSYRALLVPGAVSVFGMFLFRQAIIGVPDEIIEAGRVDGCGEFMIYLRLVMPLVRPMSAAFCLISFMGAWNAFIGPNIFIQTQEKLPLTVVLNLYMGEYAQDFGVFLAGTLIAIVPPAILFLALQKEFISGLTSGAVKG